MKKQTMKMIPEWWTVVCSSSPQIYTAEGRIAVLRPQSTTVTEVAGTIVGAVEEEVTVTVEKAPLETIAIMDPDLQKGVSSVTSKCS